MSERIWYEDLTQFMTNDTYYKIIPTQSMTMEEKLNALVRFFVYLGLILSLVRRDYKYMFFGVIAAILSAILYDYERKKRVSAERFLAAKELDIVDNKVCSRSTLHNPFMNPSIVDIHREDKPGPCTADNERVQAAIEKNFEAHLFRDVGDIFGKWASQRQFYTVPVNDQGSFASWLYGRGASCKEGNGIQCMDNLIEDVQRRPGQSSAS